MKNTQLYRGSSAALAGATGGFRSAFATRAPSVVRDGVLWREFVAVLAVCLFGVGFTCVAPADIFSACDRLKVIRVDAGSYSAQVVELQPVRYRTFEVFIDHPVGHYGLTGVLELPVSVGVESSHPQPASGFGDLLKVGNLLFKGKFVGHSTHLTTI